MPREFDIFKEIKSFECWKKHPTNVLAERDNPFILSLYNDVEWVDELDEQDASLDKTYVKKKKR